MRTSNQLPLLSILLALALAVGGCGGKAEPSSGDDGFGGGPTSGEGGGGGDSNGSGGGQPVTCQPTTCAEAGAECGWIFDGCGEILDCGGCSGGGACGSIEPNRCGICQPKSCEELAHSGKAACGAHAGGCNVTLDCGACGAGEFCGDGTHNVCVTSKDAPPGEDKPSCMNRDDACAAAGIECGLASNGCGGLIDCGGCESQGGRCGGGGVPGQCGEMPACVPKDCAALGFDCGLAVDNCGNPIDCGSLDCGERMVCGGGGANKCGAGGSGNIGDNCPSEQPTTLSGTVRTPKGANGDPLYGALVYIPKSEADIPDFPEGVSCDRCEDLVPPTALGHAITGPDGKFTLVEVPSGTQRLVIQLGKWRRVTEVQVDPCVDNVLTAEKTRLPRWQNEGSSYDNIPQIAISTGRIDALECVFRKMGVDDREFTNPDQGGRIHFYLGTESAGARISPETPQESELLQDGNRMAGYDALLFACNAAETSTTRAREDVQRLVQYANAGGRIFATHYSRDLLRHYDPLKNSADWKGTRSSFSNDVLGKINESFPKGKDFADWLENVGALAESSPTRGREISIKEARKSVSAVDQSLAWITTARNDDWVQHLTFNTPMGVPSEQQCGRVVFSDFHVTVGSSQDKTFPEECENTTLSAQEQVLEFMLFDLASCIQDDDPPPPTCTPRDCDSLGFECGSVGDGCGEVLDCGACAPEFVCGGAGVRGKCAVPCVPFTCEDLDQECGRSGDGCGGTLDCGSCPAGELCGVGGANRCGAPSCEPKTCAQLGSACGQVGDGCGGIIDCGCCPGTCPGDPL